MPLDLPAELYVPQRPAIVRAADAWKISLDQSLALHGINRKQRRAVIATLERLAKGSQVNFVAEAPALSAWAGGDILPALRGREIERAMPLLATFAAASARGLRASSLVSPLVRGTNSGETNTATGTHAVPMPAAAQSGDLGIIMCALQNNSTATCNTPSGWNAMPTLNNAQNGATQGAVGVFYRVLDGSEGSTISVTVSSSTWRGAYNSYAIMAGTYTGTPEATKNADSASGTTVTAPGMNPSWGTNAMTLIIFLGAWAHSINATADPGDMVSPVQGQGTTSNGATLRSLRQVYLASSLPGGTFTLDASSRWVSGKIAIRGL